MDGISRFGTSHGAWGAPDSTIIVIYIILPAFPLHKQSRSCRLLAAGNYIAQAKGRRPAGVSMHGYLKQLLTQRLTPHLDLRALQSLKGTGVQGLGFRV